MSSLFTLVLSASPPPAVTLTTSNSNFTSVSGTTSNTIDTLGGKVCYRCNPPSAAAYGQKIFAGSSTTVYFSVDLYYTAANSAGSKRFLQLLDSSNAQSCALAFSSNPAGTPARPVVRNAANTATTLGTQVTAYYPTTQWFRVAGKIVTNGASGTIQLRIFTHDYDTAAFYDSGSVAAFSNGANIARMSVGMLDTTGIDVGFRNVKFADDDWIGPTESAPINPIANAGPDQANLEPYVTAMLDGSLSQNATSYAWTQTSGPTVVLSDASAQKPTFTVPALKDAATLVFNLIVSNSRVNSPADSVSVTTAPHTIFRLDAGGVLSPIRLTQL